MASGLVLRVDAMDVMLRPTEMSDLKFVCDAEEAEQADGLIGQWTWAQHLEAVRSVDDGHFIVERSRPDPSCPQAVGYLILQDLNHPQGNVHLRRIVITQKGQGYGREAIWQAIRLAFDTYGAYRLWLDVKTYNPRAQTLYQSLGFVVEGTLRDCVQLDQRHRLFHQGQRRASLTVMSLLRPEYTQLATV